MFGTILEQSIFLYVIAATGICGIAAKLIMNGFLKGLVREVGSMKSTKKKALVEIRKRYEELSYLDVGIRDTRSFVEKYIYKLKLGKSYVSSWNSFCSNIGQAVLYLQVHRLACGALLHVGLCRCLQRIQYPEKM